MSVSAPVEESTFTVPGPPLVPILGPLGNLVQLTRDPLKHMGQLFKKYGPIASLAAGGRTRVFSTRPDCPGTVFVYGPELAREVEIQHAIYHKSALTGTLYPTGEVSRREQPLLEYATGLFSVNDDEHRRHRRLLAPAFHKKRIEAYLGDMVSITEEELSGWKPGEQRNIHNDMMHLTLRIATKTLFGEDLKDNVRLGEALQDSLKLVLARGTILLPYDVPGLPYHRFLNVVKKINAGIRDIIALKSAKAKNGDDIISMLLETRDEDDTMLTESEIVGHTTVIFAAGHETSSNALTWTLFLLSQHPQLAAEVLDEVEALLHGAPPSLEQLSQLPLLEATIKESMRLIPPVPWNSRLAAAPTELGGYHLPRHTEVIVSIYHTHHMSELYERPDDFNPHRWSDIERDAFEFNPFGGGPRMCIGAPFAMMEMKIVLAMMLQRYRLQFIPGTAVNRLVGFTTSMKPGLPMIVCKQDREFDRGVGNVRGNINEMVNLRPS